MTGPSAVAGFPVDAPAAPGVVAVMSLMMPIPPRAGPGIGHPDGRRGAAVLVVATSRGWRRYRADDAWWPRGQLLARPVPGLPGCD